MQEKKPKKVLKRGHNIKQKKKKGQKKCLKKFTYQSQEIHRNIFPKNSAKKVLKLVLAF